MGTIITAINPQTLANCIWEVINVAVGPSAPPIMPTDEASLLQPLRHNTKINVETKIINFFIHEYPFVKFFNLLDLFKFIYQITSKISGLISGASAVMVVAFKRVRSAASKSSSRDA